MPIQASSVPLQRRGLDLLFSALSVETIFIPPAVQREIETGLARGLTHLQPVLDMIGSGNIEVLSVEPSDRRRIDELPGGFGPGEREADALVDDRLVDA